MGDEQNEDCEHWAEGAHRLRHVCSNENRRAPVNFNAHIVDGIVHRLISLSNQEEGVDTTTNLRLLRRIIGSLKPNWAERTNKSTRHVRVL